MAHRSTQDDEVFNQSPPFAEVNPFASDIALGETVAREGAAWAQAEKECC